MKRPTMLAAILFGLLCLATPFSVQAQKKKPRVSLLKKIANYIDNSTRKGIDTAYIEVPDYPWMASIKSNVSQIDLHMKSTFDGSQVFTDVVGNMTADAYMRSDVASSLGAWIGYRGWGFGYAPNITGDKGVNWNIEMCSANYYLKFWLKHFKGDNFDMRLRGQALDKAGGSQTPQPFDFTEAQSLSSPLKIKALMLEGVYVFNRKRFSYTAAYDQSVIQRRSAGSFIAGARFFYSKYDYADDSNADLILNMADIGRIRTWQGSAGAGYAYNWVPTRGLLVSAMAMPMLTLVNHIKTYSYDSNYRQLALSEKVHDMDQLPREDYRIKLMDTTSKNCRLSLTFNARISTTYNWKRYYFTANANYYNHHFSYKQNSGSLNDWNVTAFFGVRF